VDLSNT